MKKLILFSVALMTFIGVSAQVKTIEVDSKEYQIRKTNGTLSEVNVVPSTTVFNGGPAGATSKTKNPGEGSFTSKASGCDCYIDPDGTYTLALAPNDDGSSPLITLPFSFNFYGTSYNSLYINNNGNITFTAPMGTFSSTAFPSFQPIVSPFWGDVDTRAGNGQVVYKIVGNALTGYAIYINWENVGYYSQMGDKRNSFQAILTDGIHPAVIGGNVAFCYKDMNWTTGGASSGVGGFGGIPATAGINKGDNVTYFLIGRFDQPGTLYDGPLGANDGIDYLDYKSYFLDISNPLNIPPLPSGIMDCDTIKICAASDTAYIPMYFLGPELNQTVTSTLVSATYLGNGTPSQVVSQLVSIPGQTSSLILRLVGTTSQVGYHQVTVSATDNFTTPATSLVQFIVWVDNTALVNMNPILTPTGGCGPVTAQVLNGPYDTYLWDNSFDIDPTSNITQTQLVGVTVSQNGCYKHVTQYMNIMPALTPTYTGSQFYCPETLGTQVYVNDSILYGSVSWSLNNQIVNSTYSPFLTAGTYTIQFTDALGLCTKTDQFVVTTQPFIQLQPDVAICDPSITFTTNQAGSGSGTWSFVGPNTPFFTNFTQINQTVSFPDFGSYTMIYKDALCNDSDTVVVTFGLPTPMNILSDFYICGIGLSENVSFLDSTNLTSVTWSTTPPITNIYSVNLPAGTYNVAITSTTGCPNDTTFTITEQPLLNLVPVGDWCGDTIILAFNTGAPYGNWSLVSGPGTPTFWSNTLNPKITVDKFGPYVFKYHETNCNTEGTLPINFIPNPYFQILDGETCDGDQYVFDVFDNVGFVNAADYVWTLNGTQVGTGLDFAGLQQGTYTLTGTNMCGVHQSQANLTLEVCEVLFPNVFSPDGSGVNDIWKLINDASGFKSFSIKIFNRWGNLMHEITNTTDGWDGKVDGTTAADGVYFYLMNAETISGRELVEQGYFHLISK